MPSCRVNNVNQLIDSSIFHGVYIQAQTESSLSSEISGQKYLDLGDIVLASTNQTELRLIEMKNLWFGISDTRFRIKIFEIVFLYRACQVEDHNVLWYLSDVEHVMFVFAFVLTFLILTASILLHHHVTKNSIPIINL